MRPELPGHVCGGPAAEAEALLNGAAALLPERRFIVAGPQYPAEWPGRRTCGASFICAPPEHPAFYSSSRFTLNLTRDDMVAAGYSPSVRLFEASACGAAIVSDAWAGLEEFLTPGEEILLPRDGAEVAAILSGMPDEERERIGQRARQRILDQHTSAHRAEQFEAVVEQCAGRGRRAFRRRRRALRKSEGRGRASLRLAARRDRCRWRPR